jgi:hypothetical protein
MEESSRIQTNLQIIHQKNFKKIKKKKQKKQKEDRKEKWVILDKRGGIKKGKNI